MISVIIPAFNERNNLSKLLPHLCQLAKNHEVEIIVSLGSCAEDYSACGHDGEKIKFISSDRKGRAKQMNDGVSVAKGEVLVFLHADVLPPSGFFDNIKGTLDSGHDAGFFSYRFDKKISF